MTLERHNLQSHGWEVLQDLDAADQHGNAYNEIDVLRQNLQYGARFGWIIDADGIPIYTQIAGTDGPIGGWFVVPGAGGDGGRQMGQWFHSAPAKTTSATTAVVLSAAGTPDTSLGAVTVAAVDGSTLVADMYGTIVRSSNLGAQGLIFVPLGTGGGGGGAGSFPGKITANNNDGTYTYRKTVSAAGGAEVEDATDLDCREFNLSLYVSVGSYQLFTTSPDGLHDEFMYTLDTGS